MNDAVSAFVNALNHPLKKEISFLRTLILSIDDDMSENIKWNGPNYTHRGMDRITMRIQDPKQIQLILHRGAKVLEQPTEKLIQSSLLSWKTNDRAVISLKSLEEIKQNELELVSCLTKWITVCKE